MAIAHFENTALLDVEMGVLRPAMTVLVEDDRIREVSERPIAPASAERIDLCPQPSCPASSTRTSTRPSP
jgi:imidazolonepropionase-like amidohydrolase